MRSIVLIWISMLYHWRESWRSWQIFWLSIKPYRERTRTKRKLAQRTSKDVESLMVNLTNYWKSFVNMRTRDNFKRKSSEYLNILDIDFQVRKWPRTCLIYYCSDFHCYCWDRISLISKSPFYVALSSWLKCKFRYDVLCVIQLCSFGKL